MAERRYKAKRDLVIAGKQHAAGKAFSADPGAVALPLARGWVEEAKAPRTSGKAKKA